MLSKLMNGKFLAMTFAENLQRINATPALLKSLTRLQRGLEKESLRIDSKGKMALTPHPESLGSALCHPKITTDYSESLLEFITPVHTTVTGCLNDLEEIHRFTYQKLAEQGELLWQTSMPCPLLKESEIPIAQFGSSNAAQMKSIYREGLGLRYGRMMQTISGIHYNFSLNEQFWANYHKQLGSNEPLSDFKSAQYFGLIRNFRRYAPVFVYLFGSSPALCKSFIKKQDHKLQELDEHTLYSPYSTSLRMGDLGYQSSAQEDLFVCYNSLPTYIESLRHGITEPHAHYAQQGLFDANGKQHQLNNALLQIENEFYSIIRPKRVTASGEAPINALTRSGVAYIEIRCIDVNPFLAGGIDADTLRFLDLLLLFCLFEDSPEASDIECKASNKNFKTIVNFGRKPGICLDINGEQVSFNKVASELLNKLQPLAQMLDTLQAEPAYVPSLAKQITKLKQPELTPSARVLHELRSQNLSFAQFSHQQSNIWQQHFLNLPLSNSKQQLFNRLAANSIAQQKTIEEADTVNFSDYLSDFYSQY